MKRKLLSLVCFMIISALLLCACDPAMPETNEETPGTETPGTGDGSSCEHTYSDNWLSNSEQHWHPANCEHTDLKGSLDYHSDADENGLCDTCNRNVGHTHTFADEWLTDGEYHWHSATCSHTDAKGSLGKHADSDDNHDGTCDVCGEQFQVVVENTTEALLLQILKSKSGVSTSTIHTVSDFISLGLDGSAHSESTALYEFGQNSMHCKVDTFSKYIDIKGVESKANGTYEKWQEYISNEVVFGVFTEDGSPIALDGAADINTITGHYFSVSTLADAYGPENVLYALYQLSQQDTASCYEWSEIGDASIYGSDTVYSFTFDYLQINRDVAKDEDPNVNYYRVAVEFTHNKNYVLTYLSIVCECYTNSMADERDNDYTYDDTTGTITMKPEGEYAADTYTFTVIQTAGDRSYENEYPRNKFFPDTFEVFSDIDRTTIADTTINTVTNTKHLYYLYLGDFIPEGTGVSFFPDAFVVTMSDGEKTYYSTIVGEMNDKFYVAHDIIGEDVAFKFYLPGTYTLTISIGEGNSKTFTINVTEGSGNNTGETLIEKWEVALMGSTAWPTEPTAEKLETVSFTATESGNYTFKLKTPDSGAYDKIAYDNTFGTSNPIGAYVDPFLAFGGDYMGGEFTVYIEAGTTYEFYVASYVTQTIQIECYYLS